MPHGRHEIVEYSQVHGCRGVDHTKSESNTGLEGVREESVLVGNDIGELESVRGEIALL